MKNIMNSIPKNTERPSESEYKACLKHCEQLNKTGGNLNEQDGFNCKKCNNSGFIYRPVEQYGSYSVVACYCSCMKARQTLRKLAASGLGGIITKYTFDSYEDNEQWQIKIKNLSYKFLENQTNWFYIGGQSGSGKTHICTAICGRLLKQHKSVSYMLWVNEVKQLKSTVMDSEEHNKLLDKYKNVDVLYIDDFFKQGKDKYGTVPQPTSAEIALAYEILNYRYLNKKYITIISSERTLSDILDIDEATGGRIYERCNFGEYILNIKTDRSYNYRLKKVTEI
ncbi:MAG: ATP-binding protein [Firmicutes bacterium]|nr:ATP-binding protein [Bacillota bacterium]